MEEHTIPSGLRAGDAIIAATAVENNLPIVSDNRKRFWPMKELQFKAFKP